MNKTTDIKQTNQLFKAFADPIRLRILSLLSGGELCVCQLIEVLQLPQSTISRHIAYLKRSGLINSRKEGTWNHYSLAQAQTPLQAKLMDCVHECLNDLAAVQRDRKRLHRCCGV